MAKRRTAEQITHLLREADRACNMNTNSAEMRRDPSPQEGSRA
jgi:hypothetical protein